MKSKLRPEYQKMFDELMAKKYDNDLIYTVFMKAKSLGLNDFEIAVLMASTAANMLEVIKESYITYAQNDTRPIVIPTDLNLKVVDIK